MSALGFDVSTRREKQPEPSVRRPPRGSRRRTLRAIGRLAVGLTIAVALTAGGVKYVVPSASDAEQRVAELAAARGVSESASPTPPKIAAALIATEDAGFATNIGIDPAGVLRWARGVATGASEDAGGATIEQQLAKMLYTDGHRQPIDQIEQVALALKLNADYSKPQILRMYLDTAYFGHGYYGLSAASQGYFHSPPASLDWQQAALLAGLVQAPTAYDPVQHPDLATSRRAHVLARLAATGHLTASQAARLGATSLGLG
jgi:membrane peptidoglycan carboxypeptidase